MQLRGSKMQQSRMVEINRMTSCFCGAVVGKVLRSVFEFGNVDQGLLIGGTAKNRTCFKLMAHFRARFLAKQFA